MDLNDVVQRFADFTDDAILITEAEPQSPPGPRIVWCNAKFTELTGYEIAELAGRTPRVLQGPESAMANIRRIAESLRAWRPIREQMINYRKDGTQYWVDLAISPVADEKGWYHYWVSVQRDISDIKELETASRQSQKLESVGQLASGVAHEINTPTQFISSNSAFIHEAVTDLTEAFVDAHKIIHDAATGKRCAAGAKALLSRFQELEVSYLLSEGKSAVSQCQGGVSRVREIVRSMRRLDSTADGELTPLDLNTALSSAIALTKGEWSPVAKLDEALQHDLPPVLGKAGQLGQVMVNLIVNACHAIAECDREGTAMLSIRTYCSDDEVVAQIGDTGKGIPEAIASRIFEPFFTTKEVGKGTGQGLYLSHRIITNEHSGSLTFETEEGEGTTFEIRLPRADVVPLEEHPA